MNLSINDLSKEVISDFISLPTYAILFVIYDFSIRRHAKNDVNEHLDSTIKFIMSTCQAQPIQRPVNIPFQSSIIHNGLFIIY